MKILRNFFVISLFVTITVISTTASDRNIAYAKNIVDYSVIKEYIKNSREKVKEIKNNEKNDSTIVLSNNSEKTSKRIVVFNRELSEDEKRSLETKFDITFSKRKSKNNRYLITPNNESKYELLLKDELVKSSYSNNEYKISAQVEDWGIGTINAKTAWNASSPQTGNNVIVAIIDSGVQLDHPDLVGAIQPGGYDFFNDDSDPSDDHGHGTHVAGIIAAQNNTVETVGVAYGAKILPFKACGPTSCDTLSIVDSIDAAIAANVDVINMSFAGGHNALIQQSINNATAAGIIVVAAAGNENVGTCYYPAFYSDVVCVGATNSDDSKAVYSNYGNGLDVVAPGTNILSLKNDGTQDVLSGTSMATAYYSGAAAIVKGVIKQLCLLEPTNEACTDKRAYTQALLNETSVRDIGTPGYDSQFGNGIINLAPLFGGVVVSHVSPPAVVYKGTTYTQNIIISNDNSYDVKLTNCTVTSKNKTRSQTVPAFTISTLNIGVDQYPITSTDVIYSKFDFVSGVNVLANGNIALTYSYNTPASVLVSDVIAYSFVCTFDRNDTVEVETLQNINSSGQVTVGFPTSLTNVYVSFANWPRYPWLYNYVLRRGNTMYLKNYDPAKLKVLQIYLYDYTGRRNQGMYYKWKTSSSLFAGTNYYLVRGRKYAYVVKFQDRATGLTANKSFNFYVR